MYCSRLWSRLQVRLQSTLAEGPIHHVFLWIRPQIPDKPLLLRYFAIGEIRDYALESSGKYLLVACTATLTIVLGKALSLSTGNT